MRLALFLQSPQIKKFRCEEITQRNLVNNSYPLKLSSCLQLPKSHPGASKQKGERFENEKKGGPDNAMLRTPQSKDRSMSEALANSTGSADYQRKMAKAMRVRAERHDQALA